MYIWARIEIDPSMIDKLQDIQYHGAVLKSSLVRVSSPSLDIHKGIGDSVGVDYPNKKV